MRESPEYWVFRCRENIGFLMGEEQVFVNFQCPGGCLETSKVYTVFRSILINDLL